MKQTDLREREYGRAEGVKQMAELAIEVFDKLDRETPFEMPVWAFKALHTPLGQADDYLAENSASKVKGA